MEEVYFMVVFLPLTKEGKVTLQISLNVDMRKSQFRDKTKKLAANGNPVCLLSVSVLAE